MRNIKKPFISVLTLIPFCVQTAMGSMVQANLWQSRSLPPVPVSSEQKSLPLLNIKGNPDVILIQDVHMNHQAQVNIAQTLEHLIQNHDIGVVGVEGAFGPFDFEPFRSFPDATITKQVADDFLKENLMGAASYVGITYPNVGPRRATPRQNNLPSRARAGQARPLPVFVGVDDEYHYNLNVEAVKKSTPLRDKTLDQLQHVKKQTEKEKTNVFSKELKAFDVKSQQYRAGGLSFSEYLKTLVSYLEDVPLVVEQFRAAYELEGNLDFPRAELERRHILERLTKKLKNQETNHLLEQSQKHQSGQLSLARYYQYIKELCVKKEIHLRSTPVFDDYIRYVLLADSINGEKLLAASHHMEREVYARLAKTKQEKILVQQDKALHLTTKLVNFQLTPAEWTSLDSSSPLEGRLGRSGIALAKTGGVFIDSFIDFYKQADLRSEKIVTNLLAAKKSSSGQSILLTGGFHTPLIKQFLRERNLSYAVITPKVSKVDTKKGTQYLSIFVQEKSPLDKLFSGEKLFILPSHLNIGAWIHTALINARKFYAIVATKTVAAGKRLAASSPLAVIPMGEGTYNISGTVFNQSIETTASLGGVGLSGFSLIGQMGGIEFIEKASFGQWLMVFATFVSIVGIYGMLLVIYFVVIPMFFRLGSAKVEHFLILAADVLHIRAYEHDFSEGIMDDLNRSAKDLFESLGSGRGSYLVQNLEMRILSLLSLYVLGQKTHSVSRNQINKFKKIINRLHEQDRLSSYVGLTTLFSLVLSAVYKKLSLQEFADEQREQISFIAHKQWVEGSILLPRTYSNDMIKAFLFWAGLRSRFRIDPKDIRVSLPLLNKLLWKRWFLKWAQWIPGFNTEIVEG